MPIHERTDMVHAIIEGGAIPVWTPAGANTLYLRGASIGEVIDCIITLLEEKTPSVVRWFAELSKSPSATRAVTEHGIRGWLVSRGYI